MIKLQKTTRNTTGNWKWSGDSHCYQIRVLVCHNRKVQGQRRGSHLPVAFFKLWYCRSEHSFLRIIYKNYIINWVQLFCILSFAEHRAKRQVLKDVQNIEQHEVSSSANSHNRCPKGKEDIQPLLPDDVLQALRDSNIFLKVYQKNWPRITTKKDKVHSTYNLRLKDISPESLDSMLEQVFENQTNAFKINALYGFILRNNKTKELRHFYSSTNNRLFHEPMLVKDRQGSQSFTNIFNLQDPLEYAQL